MMKLKAAPFHPNAMREATMRKKDILETYLNRAAQAEFDLKNDEREAAGECRCCFYYDGKMGSASVTRRPCACCGVILHSANTSIDMLCLTCADKHKLCVHCGADRELRVRRKKWPTKKQENEDDAREAKPNEGADDEVEIQAVTTR